MTCDCRCCAEGHCVCRDDPCPCGWAPLSRGGGRFVPDPVEESIARAGAAYAEAGFPPITMEEPEEPDIDILLRMAEEHGALTGKVAGLAGQVRDLRAALRLVLKATDRYSDSRRAPWWLEAHRAVSRSKDA